MFGPVWDHDLSFGNGLDKRNTHSSDIGGVTKVLVRATLAPADSSVMHAHLSAVTSHRHLSVMRARTRGGRGVYKDCRAGPVRLRDGELHVLA